MTAITKTKTLGFPLLVVATSVVLGAAVAASSQRDALYVGGAMAAVGATCVFVVRPKLLVAAVILIALFVESGERALHTTTIAKADDLAVLAAIGLLPMLRVAKGLPPRLIPGGKWLLVYGGLGVLSCLLHSVPLHVAASGTYLAMKGVLFGIAVAQIDWTTDDLETAAKWAGRVIAFCLAAAAVNLVMPGRWAAMISVLQVPEHRGPIPSLLGPFEHPEHFGHVMALAAVALLAYRSVFGKSRATTILLAGTIIGNVLSFRRKAIIGLVTAGIAVRSVTHKAAVGVFVFLAVPAIAIVFWGQIRTVSDSTYRQYVTQASGQAARTVLYRNSFSVARDYFPLGAGFGRYGSHTAVVHYSPIYYARGFEQVYGLEPADTVFGSDTFWPAVIGESGFLGLLAFAAGLGAIILAARRWVTNNDRWLHLVGLVTIGWAVEFLVESIAAPVFVGPPTYPLLFALVGIGIAREIDLRTEHGD